MKSFAYKIILVLCFCLVCVIGRTQTIIQMEEYGGVYRIPCKVNGAKMKLIFDTGADKVCISLAMAEYLLDNDYISTNDFMGGGASTVADGRIVDHIKINIKDIEIQGIHLKNVKAIVIDGQNAPLLLGQSAIKKLGKYSISGTKLIIGESSVMSSQPLEETALTDEEIDKLAEEADLFYYDHAFYLALEKYKILYENDALNAYGILFYADCYFYTDQTDYALELYKSIESDIETDYQDYRIRLWLQIGKCYHFLEEYDNELPYMQKVQYYSEPWSYYEESAILLMSHAYHKKGDGYRATKTIDDYISKYLSVKNLKATDCWTIYLKNDFLAELFLNRALFSSSIEDKKYFIISAAWGNEKSREYCKEFSLDYFHKPKQYSY